MEMTQWILVALGVLTGASNIIAFMTRQQMQINKLETNNSLAQMEIRLTTLMQNFKDTLRESVENKLSGYVSQVECTYKHGAGE